MSESLPARAVEILNGTLKFIMTSDLLPKQPLRQSEALEIFNALNRAAGDDSGGFIRAYSALHGAAGTGSFVHWLFLPGRTPLDVLHTLRIAMEIEMRLDS